MSITAPVCSFPDAVTEWSLDGAVAAFFAMGFKDGDIVSHDWLQSTLQIPKAKAVSDVVPIQWLLLERVEQFKMALLTNHNIALASVRGQGYRIVPPSDQAHFAVTTTMRSVRKEFAKGLKVLEHTRTDLLDAREKQRHVDAEVKMSGLSRLASKARRDVLGLFKS